MKKIISLLLSVAGRLRFNSKRALSAAAEPAHPASQSSPPCRMRTYGDVERELAQANTKIAKLQAKLDLALPALEKAEVYLPFAWRGTPDEQELKVAIMQLKETV